jgi:hypothetical protein
LFTVATAVLDEVHGLTAAGVPDPVKAIVDPSQTAVGPVIVGCALTVTVTVCVLVHPAAEVPVTVYVVVVAGLAVTVAPVVADNPVAGDHE